MRFPVNWTAPVQAFTSMKYSRRITYMTLLIIFLLFLARTYPGSLLGVLFLDRRMPYSVFNLNTHTGQPDTRLIKTILLWTPFFSTKDYMKPMAALGCPETRCNVTSDRSLLSQSDAIIFHHRDINPSDLPTIRHSWQRWVYLNHESPPNSPRNVMGLLQDKFNWTVTYRLDSDIILTPLPHPRKTEMPEAKNVFRNKTRMAVWFVSNCHTSGNREAFVAQLRKTIPVDVYGDCGHKKCIPKMSETCYKDAASRYRFYLSFENSICKDYVTEKLYHVYDYDMVPVVFGGSDYTKVAPVGSYINAMDFNSPRALGKHLLKLAKSPETYNKFFEWKTKYENVVQPYPCRLCEMLHDSNELSKIWTDIEKWWYDDANCRRWPN